MQNLWSPLGRSPQRKSQGYGPLCAAIPFCQPFLPPRLVSSGSYLHGCASLPCASLPSQYIQAHIVAWRPCRTRAKGVRQIRTIFHAAFPCCSSESRRRLHREFLRIFFSQEWGKTQGARILRWNALLVRLLHGSRSCQCDSLYLASLTATLADSGLVDHFICQRDTSSAGVPQLPPSVARTDRSKPRAIDLMLENLKRYAASTGHIGRCCCCSQQLQRQGYPI